MCLVGQSRPTLCKPWTAAYQAPPSMGFSRQEYWSGLPFPSPGDLPNPGIEPMSHYRWILFTFKPLGKSYINNTLIISQSVQSFSRVQLFATP